jgi:polyisoprenoid-binding protein YceI
VVKFDHQVSPFGYGALAMSINSGTYILGPDNGELMVRTGRSGAAAKAGHDLVIEVSDWKATVEIAADGGQSRVELTADGGSLIVREGKGGIQSLGDDDKRGIRETIDKEILKRTSISFRSNAVEPSSDASRLQVEGELELLGRRAPITFELTPGGDGSVTASAVVRQSGWGIKPYSALFGTLKVADEVEITFAGRLSG